MKCILLLLKCVLISSMAFDPSGMSVNVASRNLTVSMENNNVDNTLGSPDENGIHQDSLVSGSSQPQSPSIVHHPAMVRSIDKSIDPCDDFYSFMCNGWMKENPIPEDKKGITHTMLLEEKITKQLREFITNPSLVKTREQKLMQIYYGKCVESQNVTPDLGIRMLLDRLRLLREQSLFLTDWLIAMNPLTVMYDVMVLPDDYNSTFNILTIVPSPPLQSFQTYFDPAYASEYVAMRKALFDFLTLLSHDDKNHEFFFISDTEKWRRVESLLRVDETIAKIQQETEFNSNGMTVTVLELGMLLETIDWPRYLFAILPPSLWGQLEEMPVSLKQAMTIYRYEELFLNMDKQTLADFLDWKVIFHYAPYLGAKYTRLLETYNKQVYGVVTKDRTRDCIENTVSFFSDVVGAMWIDKYFDFSTISKVGTLIKDIRDAFLRLLDTNDWMEEKTKEKAREKAHAIVPFIGFDANLYKQENIAKKFKMLTFTEQTPYYAISEMLETWFQQLSLMKLETLNRRDAFEAKATDTNAFYDPSQNQIAILAGILQEPFFNTTWPETMNLASIGMVIGHEITHGFDDYGAYFDSKGNRVNWWDERTFSRFEAKRECIEKQYDSITVADGVKINGRKTEGENIADNGGMRASIRAAFNGNRNEPFLVQGLESYSAQQIFFMTYGFTWCGNMRDHTLLNDLATDVHSPNTVRVNVVLGNQPEFAKAFKCPIDSKQNPRRKCTVW